MKKEFFYYIAPLDNSKNYSVLYKLVFLKSFLCEIDNLGKAKAYNVAIRFKEYCIKYKLIDNSNLFIDDINRFSIEAILSIIKLNPFKAINEKGFIINNIYEEEYFEFNSILMSEFIDEDFITINKILDSKLNMFFNNNKTEIKEVKEVKENNIIYNYNNIFEEIKYVSDYIDSKGFSYETNLIENLYLCLKSKPFVILAGISGTGKTKLVKLFAEAIGATIDNGRYKLISVRPDWSDASDLFGHLDLNGRYVCGVLTQFIKSAILNQNLPYFLCLDEMNLARVEYYMSDILSIIETRYLENNIIKTNYLIPIEAFGKDINAKENYSKLYLPENLYIIGTVNMDETTFPFSKKVLDRVNTIEFSYIDLELKNTSSQEILKHELYNSFLKSEYLILKDCYIYEKIITDTINCLKKINNILNSANMQVGYRIRDEICFYMIYNERYNILEFNDAMDLQISQKILPRIQGSSISIKNILIELFKICTNNSYEHYNINEQIYKDLKKNKSLYYKSATKLAFMIKKFEEDGFTSYWF